MNTCRKCGCYLPDNWTYCPACKTKTDISVVYWVNVKYKDATNDSHAFGIYKNALEYVNRRMKEETVASAIILEGLEKKVLDIPH